MASSDGVCVYLGVYGDGTAAEHDWEVAHAWHSSDLVGRFELALFTLDENGAIQVHHRDASTRTSTIAGAVVGVIVGVIFPGMLVAGAVVGAGLGAGVGVADNFGPHRISRKQLEELGSLVGQGETALVVVGDAALLGVIDDARMTPLRSASRTVQGTYADLERDVRTALEEHGDIPASTDRS